MKNNLKAFTLAEVLITLLIIGVVASLVIPAIINDTQKEEFVTGAKKTYSVLNQVAELIKMDNGGTYVDAFLSTSDTVNKFAEKLSYTAKCTNATNDGTCWHLDNTMMKTLDGLDWGTTSPTTAQGLKLNDGNLVWFIQVSKDCSNSSTWSLDTSNPNNPFNYVCSLLIIDVNGFKSPNRMGRDIFEILLTARGFHAIGEQGSYYGKSQNWSRCTLNSGNTTNGASCFARIMDEGGMKY
jgi:prepilin-type N-terminal cleavage/methylation domain-containing protein